GMPSPQSATLCHEDATERAWKVCRRGKGCRGTGGRGDRGGGSGGAVPGPPAGPDVAGTVRGHGGDPRDGTASPRTHLVFLGEGGGRMGRGGEPPLARPLGGGTGRDGVAVAPPPAGVQDGAVPGLRGAGAKRAAEDAHAPVAGHRQDR